MPMVTKLLMVVTYPPLGAPILRMTWVTWGHVTNWKKYISTFSRRSPLNLASCWLEKWDSESKRLNRHRFNFLFIFVSIYSAPNCSFQVSIFVNFWKHFELTYINHLCFKIIDGFLLWIMQNFYFFQFFIHFYTIFVLVLLLLVFDQ